ncbi:transporter substrate-binding domain-containing protein [Shinella sp. JR1-6]|jgi:polar amino acid transport system substrate-binding protein|uniref:transporter substrate-binding domain-containing protein n=1 Tax=Shinella sp. JR1-6 TaxID=2527671 RepID=UPI00102D6040|nr:transporter substrate-binding domain-containing protein [Shinella sp. JR1-6]TAA60819.1 transporter substrate-binding domain-containing protein [Shinella sp. JR1-6]
MRHIKIAPLKIYGLFAFGLLLAAVQPQDVVAQEPASVDLPILFDTRERIARPDLSGIVRLRFLTTVDFPPFNFIDQTGKLAGFHVDLVREICRELALTEKCQIQAVTFPELEKALIDGNGEAVAAGVAVTAELRKRFVFSRPFMRLPARFAVAKKTPPAGATAAALDGKRVGVVAASAHEAMLKAFFPRVQAEAFADRAALLASLKDGKVEAVFGDGMQLAFWTSGSESAGCCRLFDGPYLSERFLGEGLTIMFRKEDATITGAIDHALLALSRSGRLQEIYLRYFPVNLYGG